MWKKECIIILAGGESIITTDGGIKRSLRTLNVLKDGSRVDSV